MQNADIDSAIALFSDQFELERTINIGANGYILLGRHTILERPAAIKIFGCDEGDIREPSLLASCEHQNIVKIYHAQRDEHMSNMCYFMEYCDSDLSAASILEGTKLSTLLLYIHGLLSGLSHIHTRNPPIIHGDIKPDNILLKEGVAKLCDFGSASVLQTPDASVPACSILSKPPEMFSESPTYDQRSDIYQVGVLAYSLLGGRFESELTNYLTREQRKILSLLTPGYEQVQYIDNVIGSKITSGQLLNWGSIYGFLPNKVIRVIRKALAIKAEERYSSAAEMLLSLNNCRDYIDWELIDENNRKCTFKGQEYFFSFDQRHWVASKYSTQTSRRQMLRTKDANFVGCLGKFKTIIRADRDS